MTTPQYLILISILILVVNNFSMLRRLFVKKNS